MSPTGRATARTFEAPTRAPSRPSNAYLGQLDHVEFPHLHLDATYLTAWINHRTAQPACCSSSCSTARRIQLTARHRAVVGFRESANLLDQALSQTFDRLVRRAPGPTIRFHDLRHTHATLLIAAGVPAKAVAERLGHSRASFIIDSYQHVLPGMQADAAAIFAELVTDGPSTGSSGSTREKNRRKSACTR